MANKVKILQSKELNYSLLMWQVWGEEKQFSLLTTTLFIVSAAIWAHKDMLVPPFKPQNTRAHTIKTLCIFLVIKS